MGPFALSKVVSRKAGHSEGNISSIMHLGLANMLMWQAIKEEKDNNIDRYHNIINVSCIAINKTTYDTNL